MRHNLPFRNKITIQIQNLIICVLSPLAWSRRNVFFRSRSRSRLKYLNSVCLQTLPMLFFLHSRCFEDINLDYFTRTPTDILTSHWWHFIRINLFHEKTPNLITNTTKKELSNLMQTFWSYARTCIFAVHFYSYC